MSLFYVYATDRSEENIGRFVITFANRNVADEWWRAISLGGHAALSSSVQRVAPQFYTYDRRVYFLEKFLVDQVVQSVAEPFKGKMFFTLESDKLGGANWGAPRGLTTLPPQDIVDHVSGTWFYIRSRSIPGSYWYYDIQRGIICTSTERRSQFRVAATNVPNGTIMIGADVVNIRVNDQFFVIADTSGNLVVNQGPWPVEFAALGDGRIHVSESGELKFVDRDDSRRHESWVLA